MRKNEKGFGVVEILLVILVIGLLVAVGWMFFDRQKNKQDDKITDAQQTTQKTTEQQPSEDAEVVKTSIYPNDSSGSVSKDSYKVTLPDGWSVQNVFEPYNIVKTVGNDKYLIGSFIEENSDRSLMKQRVAEGIETVKAVKTSLGTDVSVLKTPTTLFLASCKPTGEDCYLQLNGKKLYIHLYQVIPNAQSATNIDYSSESAKQIINDFESIAKSLSI